MTKFAMIGGTGRHGSTLLERSLGQIPGVVSVGELDHLPSSLLTNRPCSCGAPVLACPFWSEVGERAFVGGWNMDLMRRLARYDSLLKRHVHFSMLLMKGAAGIESEQLEEFAVFVKAAVRAIRGLTGAKVVVDSSKVPRWAVLVRLIGLDPLVIHLVRDSRGVAYSWAKQSERGGISAGHGDMARWTPARSATRWVVYNGVFEALKMLGTPHLLVRYEDLVARPKCEIKRVAEWLDDSIVTPPEMFSGRTGVRLTQGHSIAGNPGGAREGVVDVRVDDEWTLGLGPYSRALVTAITLPLLRRYGYAVKPKLQA